MKNISNSPHILLPILIAGLSNIAPALAQERELSYYNNPLSTFEFNVSTGVLGLEAREHVFSGAGSTDNLSLLIWQSTTPVVTGGFSVDFDDWTLSGTTRIAAGGMSYMEDYDWLAPYAPSYAFSDWSHQSQHDNTNLDWYLNTSLSLGKNFDLSNNTSVNLNGGLKYVDVQWAAVDGTFVYSVGGFRDTSGAFTGPSISYRQQLPSTFLGVDLEIIEGDWTIGLGAQAGVTMFATATDWHWARTPPLRFFDLLDPAPTLAASAEIAYQLQNTLELFVAADVEKTFLARADSITYVHSTNAVVGTYADQTGGELLSGSVSIGVKGHL